MFPRAEAGTSPDRDRDRDHDRTQAISFTVTLDPRDVTVSRSDQSGYDRILLRGHQPFPNPDWVGAPLLPAIQDRLVLPEGMRVARLTVTTQDPQFIATGVRPEPIPPPESGDTTFVWQPDPRYYQEGDVFPPTPEVLVSNDSYRGIRLADVAAVPLLWDPVSTNLVLFRTVEVTVQLEPVPEGEAAPPRLRPERRFSRDLYELAWVRDHVRNREDVDRHYPARRSRDRDPDHDPNELHVVADTAHATGFHPTDLPSLEGPAIDMVILTGDGWANGIGDPGDMAAAFQEWADWRTQTGVPTVVRTVQWVREHYSGGDDPARIRAFLREAYSKWGTDYLLIGGDVEVVPARMFGPDGSSVEYPLAWYYSELDTDWGLIDRPFFGGNTFGTYPELWLGRVPTRSASEAEAYLAKIRTYERVPGLSLPVPDDAYYTKAVLFAGLTNSGAWDQEDDRPTQYPTPPQSTPWWQNGVWQAEQIKETVLDSLTFESYRLYPNLTSSKSCKPGTSYDCYKKQRDYYAANGAPEAYFTHANILDALRTEEASVVFHVEHSHRWVLGGISEELDQVRPARDVCLEPSVCSEAECTSWATSCRNQYLADNPQVPISREALDALSNGPNYWVGLSYGSMTGMYDGDAVAEHLVRDPDGGAVAWCGKSVSSNLYGWRNFEDVSSGFFWKALTHREPVGTALVSAGILNGNGVTRGRWNLFGDPSLRAWSEAPGDLWLSSSVTQLGNPDFYDLTITARSGSSTGAAVANARVCLSRDDDVYAVGWTDAAGEVRFPSVLVAYSSVGIDVWAVADNFEPKHLFIEEADQSELEDAPVPIYESHAISDSLAAGLEPDLFEAGDRLSVDVTVRNVAAVTAPGAQAKLVPTPRVRMHLELEGGAAPAEDVFIGGGNAHPPEGQPEFSLLVNESGLRPEREPTVATPNQYRIWRGPTDWDYRIRVDWASPLPTEAATGTVYVDGGIAIDTTGVDGADDVSVAADGKSFTFSLEPDATSDLIVFEAEAPEWVTMVTATTSYDSIPPNSAAQCRFVIDLERLSPDQRLSFSLLTRVGTGGGVTRMFTDFLVETAAPEVSFALQKLESTLTGGCSCTGGRSAYRLRPTLRNTGNADADSVEVLLGWSGADVAMCSGGDAIWMTVPARGGATASTGFQFCDSPTTRTLRVESLTIRRTVNGVIDTLQVVDPATAYNPWPVGGSTYQVVNLTAHPTTDGFRAQWEEPSAWEGVSTDPIGYHVYIDSAGVQRRHTLDMVAEAAQAWTIGQPHRDVNGEVVDYRVGVTGISSNYIEGPILWTSTRPSSIQPRPGWPKRMPTGAARSVLAVDLDADGDLEVLAGGRVLAAWDPDGDAIAAADANGLLYNPLDDEDIDTESDLNLWGELAAGDLDDDGETEIAMMFGDSKLHLVDQDGTGHWAYPLSVDARSTPTFADLDEDGDLEIIVNGYGEGDLYVWHQDGAAYRTNGGRYVNLSLADQYNYSGVAVADVDPSSAGLEIAQSLWNGELKLWKTQSGSGNPASSWSKGPCDTPPCNVNLSTPAIADFDADDDPDVIVSSNVNYRRVASFETPSGTFGVVWRGKTSADGPYHYPYRSNEPAQAPAIAELDPTGNGVPEVLMGRQVVPDGSTVPDDATVRASLFFKRGAVPGNDAYGRGTTLTDTIPLPGRLRESQGITRGNPIVGDIDGDGRQEMIVGSNHGALFAWEFTPTSGDSFTVSQEPGWPLQFSDLPSNPTIADLDQSGDTLQLLVGTEDGYVYVYDLPEMGVADVEWPTAAHDVARTGNYPNYWLETIRSGSAADAQVDERVRTGPNPFGPDTAVRFRLLDRQMVTLAVYDAGGREVRRLWSGELDAGRHEFEWNGRDDQDRRVASGVYFLKMAGSAGTQTRRLVLAR